MLEVCENFQQVLFCLLAIFGSYEGIHTCKTSDSDKMEQDEPCLTEPTKLQVLTLLPSAQPRQLPR